MGVQQFLATQQDCYFLLRNFFDGGGLNRGYVSSLNYNDWASHAFAIGISLSHNDETKDTDRLISGLNTNGSSIPVQFTVNNPASTNAVGYRPVVFAELTSTLMIYAGRVVSVIN